MSLAVTITSVDVRNGKAKVSGRLTASGSYSTGGDTIDFTSATQDAKFTGIAPFIPSSQPPSSLSVWSEGGNITDYYACTIGSAQNNCLFNVATAFGTELSAGAYPAGITGDTIAWEAEFPALL